MFQVMRVERRVRSANALDRGTLRLRPRPLSSNGALRRRSSVVICVRKTNQIYTTSTTSKGTLSALGASQKGRFVQKAAKRRGRVGNRPPGKDSLKVQVTATEQLRLLNQTSRHTYVLEETGASGTLGKVVPKEEAPPPAPPVAEKVENVSVPEPAPMLSWATGDPIRTVALGSAVILGLFVISTVFKRVIAKRSPREPLIPVSKAEGRMAEKQKELEEEFANLLTEQLEQREEEHRKQLVEELGKKEGEFDAKLATLNREVRKKLDAEYKTQLEQQAVTLSEDLTQQKDKLTTELTEKFEDQKAELEMDWMKQLEAKSKEQKEYHEATLEAEKLVQELRSSQEQLQKHEASLEAQLKEYESLLETLKRNHKVELEGAVSSYEAEVRGLKEQIRSQEGEIKRRQEEKKQQEELQSAALMQESVQENGHLMEEETEKQSVALKTKLRPEELDAVPEELRVHENGLQKSLFQAEIRMEAAGITIPHIDKVLTGGEDAFFVSSMGYGAMGVADGVGSWSRDGINPAAYSQGLMSAASHYLNTQYSHAFSLTQLMEHAHDSVKSAGSATMCVACIQPDGLLEVANLGDCGVRVIRGQKCVFATEPMSHEFNMPFQLADPAKLPDTDYPSDAEHYSFVLEQGDVIIMGSDGLFDNLWDDDLTRLINSFVGEDHTDEATAQLLAKHIADVAHYNAKQKKIRSPWAVHAAQWGNVEPPQHPL